MRLEFEPFSLTDLHFSEVVVLGLRTDFRCPIGQESAEWIHRQPERETPTTVDQSEKIRLWVQVPQVLSAVSTGYECSVHSHAEILNPAPRIRNPKPETRNPKPRNPEHRTLIIGRLGEVHPVATGSRGLRRGNVVSSYPASVRMHT